MSLVFNDTSTYKGLVQMYEEEIGADIGFVSGNTVRLKKYTAEANVAFDELLSIGFTADGTWQLDDSNHTDHAIIRTNIVSGQRDYPVTSDETGNLVLDFFRVRVADASGNYRDIKPRDLQSETAFDYFDSATGVPSEYDKTGNTIILGSTPNYNATNGLEIYINREPSYFAYTDTTKKPGVPGNLHRWFVVRPAETYARRNSLTNYGALRSERMELEATIKETFAARSKDERKRLTVGAHSNK